MNVEQIIQNKQGTVVDVRTPGEFAGGHIVNSINIPLHEISDKIEELKNLKSPLLLCCASENRSGQAHQYLLQQGIDCINGGSWLDIDDYHSQ